MIILASTSVARQTLLRNAGVSFTAESPNVDERALASCHPEWRPREIALQLARAKAEDVSRRFPEILVIGADQVLACGDSVFSKPRDQVQCRQQLMALRGNPHMLISAVVSAYAGHSLWSHVDDAQLTMRHFSEEFLDNYVAAIGAGCTSTVGGYKIEGLGLQLFEKVEGDHFTILGLPLLALLQHLREKGELPS
ncbi:MAG: Maf family nucleotide pyrophosphatase [Aestuariivirga sp.]|uniref:Maf family nucleotide pyrophosphatase n=1 Tax=Aestuariivirga sp. TaxID=2650926 RepID=UPI0038CF4779